MFTAKQRDHVRNYMLEVARSDPRVTAGALIGSTAFGGGDDWSDIDITFGIVEGTPIEAVLHDWTEILKREFGVLDHFDLRSGSSIYRVFLLADGLEIDVSVTPEQDFGAHGANFHIIFGTYHQLEEAPQPKAAHLIGLAWHHVLHARSCIERKKCWQAAYWISEMRNHVLALACIRLGENAFYARGVDKLPADVTNPLVDTLVRSLDEAELRRALAVATTCLIGEVERWDAMRGARLRPILLEFGGLLTV